MADPATGLISTWPCGRSPLRGLWPTLPQVGYDRFAGAMRQALRPLYVDLGVQIVSESAGSSAPSP